jgi:hypothetical protein
VADVDGALPAAGSGPSGGAADLVRAHPQHLSCMSGGLTEARIGIAVLVDLRWQGQAVTQITQIRHSISNMTQHTRVWLRYGRRLGPAAWLRQYGQSS